MPVVEEFLKVSDVKSKKQFNLSIFWKVEAFSLTPGTRGFFSAVAGFRCPKSEAARKKTFKYLTETGNRAGRVSGTQGIFL